MPEWLEQLVADVWEDPEWHAWETMWKPQLLKHGVTPDDLQPVGDPSRPIAIGLRPPHEWRTGAVSWDEGDRTAVLSALNRLVQALEA
jgi:hypothetical protein